MLSNAFQGLSASTDSHQKRNVLNKSQTCHDLLCRILLLMPPAYATLRVWSFCLRDTFGGFAYATNLRHLMRVEFSLRAGRCDMTLTKHEHGGVGRRSDVLLACWPRARPVSLSLATGGHGVRSKPGPLHCYTATLLQCRLAFALPNTLRSHKRLAAGLSRRSNACRGWPLQSHGQRAFQVQQGNGPHAADR